MMPLKLLKGIHRFKNHQYKEKQDLFTSLSTGQSPDVVFITCADSRIIPSLFTQADLGELFSIRNAGNIIAPAAAGTSGEAATLEFALKHLKVPEIIICGHSHCGAMRGLMTPDLEHELPLTHEWLKHARPALEHLHERHPSLACDPTLELMHLTQDNVLLQIEHLKTHPSVKARLEQGTLKIHGWYYEFEHGEIFIYNAQKDCFLSFDDTVAELARDRLAHYVEIEALAYLRRLPSPKTKGELEGVIDLFSSLKFNNVGIIWSEIQERVSAKLLNELGELYVDNEGNISADFYKVVEQGSCVCVKNKGSVQKMMQNTRFYMQRRESFLFSLTKQVDIQESHEEKCSNVFM